MESERFGELAQSVERRIVNPVVSGSSPLFPANLNDGSGVGQLVARQAHNLKVAGSSPVTATTFNMVLSSVLRKGCRQVG